MRLTLRSVLFRLHWALGLTAGLVLAVMGVTGALMSYEEAITGFLDRDLAVVAAGEQTVLGPTALVAALAQRYPSSRVTTLLVPLEPGKAARAYLSGDAAGARPPSVYLDPRTGAVLGEARGESTFTTIRELHRWLLIPGKGKGWGRTLTGICACALLVFLATGLYLRWPKIHRWRIWLKPQLGRPGRPRWWSLHAVIGTWLIPIYVIMALTGLWWSYDAYRAGATWLLTGKPPDEKAERAARRPAAGGATALDAAWTNFLQAAGKEAARAVIFMPAADSAVIRIRWYARGADEPHARNLASYDRATGAPIESTRYDDKALGQRIADNMLEVHRGRFFGSVFTLLFGLAALAMPLFAATGITLYLLRRRVGRRQARLAPRVSETGLPTEWAERRS